MTDENKNKKESLMIPTKDLLTGFYASLHNAENFLKSCKTLLEKDEFQSCIPLAIISMEESLKGLELLTRFRKNEDLTNKIWTDLKNHKHKLTYVMNESLKSLKKATKEDLENAKTELGKFGRDLDKTDISKTITDIQKRIGINSNFQELKEACFYVDWDVRRGEWMLFDELPKDYMDKLTFYVVSEAELTLNLLKIMIEMHINRLRKTNQLLEKLPYPSYVEYRTPENFESNALQDLLKEKINQVKHAEGLKVIKQFIEQKSFRFLSFGIFRKTMLEYFKVIEKQDFDQRLPHPLIKAMLMATSKVQELNKDGENIAAISDDADVTYSGKPMMVFNVIATKKLGVCEFVNVTELKEDFECTSDIIEKIIRTEIILERQIGKDVPFAFYIEALNVIGIKTKMIKLDEIPNAIREAKRSVNSGKLKVPDSLKRQILAIISADEWDDLDMNVRTIVCTAYGSKKYPEYNSCITPSNDIRKSKCRQIILVAIKQQYLQTA